MASENDQTPVREAGSLASAVAGRPANRHIEERPGRQARRIPPGGAAVVGHGHEGAAHPERPRAHGFERLGGRRALPRVKKQAE